MSDLHVLIAGGGLSGLCLAQGLRRAGVSCAVYERDPEARRKAGYRLTMNADGGNALRDCLDDDLYELYLQASRTTPPRQLAVVVDDQLHELTSMPHHGPPNEGDRPHTAIHRRTLRQILMGRIGDLVHQATAVGFEREGDRVRLLLDDGTTAEGDLLVAADGASSPIRTQLMPGVEVFDTGVTGLSLFSRSPLPPEVLAELPEVLLDGFVIARDREGTMMGLGACTPREPVAEAAARLAPDVRVDPVEPYMMLSGSAGPGATIPPPQEWTPETPALMHAGMLAAIAGWHPALVGLVERLDVSTLFSISWKRLDCTPAWESSNVTVVGDAIHAMLPTRGQGANTALRDAAVLSRQLAAAQAGEVALLDAVAAYEQDMRDYVYPIMDMSADHDRFGGGGLRREPQGSSAAS